MKRSLRKVVSKYCKTVKMDNIPDFPYKIRPLTAEEGGGFLVSYPDFDECIGEGETEEKAIADGREALTAVIEVLKEKGGRSQNLEAIIIYGKTDLDICEGNNKRIF